MVMKVFVGQECVCRGGGRGNENLCDNIQNIIKGYRKKRGARHGGSGVWVCCGGSGQ